MSVCHSDYSRHALPGRRAFPSTTAIGEINLPNANWIRAAHGSKSASLSKNITEAFMTWPLTGNGFNEEFRNRRAYRKNMEDYLISPTCSTLTFMNISPHASGLHPVAVHSDTQRERTALERSSRRPFSSYYLADPKLLELGVIGQSGCL